MYSSNPKEIDFIESIRRGRFIRPNDVCVDLSNFCATNSIHNIELVAQKLNYQGDCGGKYLFGYLAVSYTYGINGANKDFDLADNYFFYTTKLFCNKNAEHGYANKEREFKRAMYFEWFLCSLLWCAECGDY
ncbi:hypothetical protein AGMMS49975_29860 [Clostridia bacterium]|nr:hypothetical protein AGMMS49975_29860 [Clostridia bacterium]